MTNNLVYSIIIKQEAVSDIKVGDMMKNPSFKVITKGLETVCEVIATYHDDDTNKDFMVYTDIESFENNNLKLYYSLYENSINGIKLINIESSEDKKIGLQLVQEILKELA